MHEPKDSSQLELFSQSDNGQELKPHYERVSFFTRIRGYEKALLIVMAFVLSGILCFSLGVEKGKQANPAFGGSLSRQAGYTIQLSAYRNKEEAFKEMLLLKSHGFSPQAFKKGDYIILCVGKFSNLESAQPLLEQLQRTYAGCHIRRL